jgi:Zn-dependent peptidase ImmA (M78 family)/transcriptional regulator with XRE-family HTH domain
MRRSQKWLAIFANKHYHHDMTVTRETLAERVSRAMAEAGMSQAELAATIRISPSALSRALSGQRNFKSLEIGLIAKALRVSTQYLLADEEAPRASLAARAQPSSNPTLVSALARVDDILELDDLLADLGFDAITKLGSYEHGPESPFKQGEILASQLRNDMGLGDEDLPYDLPRLSTLLEDRLGIDVDFEPLTNGLDGLSIARRGFRLALISSGVSATRQRFTLAHELAHLAAGDSQELLVDENLFGRKTHDEQRANSFAAAFLMPASAIRSSVRPGFISEELVAELLGRFGVSLDALAFRLHNIGVVNANGRERIRAMSSSRIALRSGRATDLQARNDRRAPGKLLLRAAEAYVVGQISIRPVARLLDVDPELLLDELSPPHHTTVDLDVDVNTMEPAL